MTKMSFWLAFLAFLAAVDFSAGSRIAVDSAVDSETHPQFGFRADSRHAVGSAVDSKAHPQSGNTDAEYNIKYGHAPDPSEATFGNTDAEYNIEYGYAPDPSEATFLRARGRLFSFKRKIDFRHQEGTHLVTFAETTSENATELADYIAASMHSQGSVRSWGAAFGGAASASTQETSSNSVRALRVDRIAKVHDTTVKGPRSVRHLVSKLAPGVEEAFNTQSSEDIYRDFGPFRAVEIELGGIFRSTSIREMRESDDRAEVQATMLLTGNLRAAQASMSASGSYSTESTQDAGRTTTTNSAQGGNVTLWLGASHHADYAAIQQQWSSTVTNRPAGIRYVLEPLWRLIRLVNPDKGAAFENYCNNKWQEESEEVRSHLHFARGFPQYVMLNTGAAGCDLGKEITTADECVTALTTLNLTLYPNWNGRYLGGPEYLTLIPRFCSVNPQAMPYSSGNFKYHMHFSRENFGLPQGHLAPVCKA